MTRFLLFALVGTAGFAIDLAVLLTAIPFFGAYGGRAVSASVAIASTWILNRYVTFHERRSSRKAREFAAYFSSQLVGMSVNVGVYVVLMALSGWMSDRPGIALAAGSASAMLVNFVGSQVFVFRRKGAEASSPERRQAE